MFLFFQFFTLAYNYLTMLAQVVNILIIGSFTYLFCKCVRNCLVNSTYPQLLSIFLLKYILGRIIYSFLKFGDSQCRQSEEMNLIYCQRSYSVLVFSEGACSVIVTNRNFWDQNRLREKERIFFFFIFYSLIYLFIKLLFLFGQMGKSQQNLCFD